MIYNMSRLPILRFQVGNKVFSSMGMSIACAEKISARTGNDVSIHHNINGKKSIDIHTVIAKRS